MYFTDCKVISVDEEIDIQMFKGYKAIGFISLTTDEWKTEDSKSKIEFLEQFLVLKDECFFYVSISNEIREKFISILMECNSDFSLTDNSDFIVYYYADQIKHDGTEIYITELSPSIEFALEEIEETISDLKKGLFLTKIKKQAIEKSGLFLFEILKKIITSYI